MKSIVSSAILGAARAPRSGYKPRYSAAVIGSQSSRSRAYSSLHESGRPKNVIVTGSSRGIGKAIVLRLASDGYNVCINDISANAKGCDEVVKEIQGMGRKAIIAIADVSKRDQVKQMVEMTVKELGPLDTMIANAGIAHVQPVLEIAELDIERLFRINMLGVHNCYAEAALQMISQGTCTPSSPGKLIAAASVAALKPMALLGHYSATKFAVRGLTQAYALELAQHNITVNAYGPGIVGTEMWDLIDEGMGKRTGARKGEVFQRKARESAVLGRPSVPEHVSKLVSFLASSDSDFVTGQTQIVDGGIVFH